MKIKCFRCSTEIDTPDKNNADYVIADDMVAQEPCDILYSLEKNELTSHKAEVLAQLIAKGVPIPPEALITDEDYTWQELPGLKDTHPDQVKVLARSEIRPVQKAGIICPNCFNLDTDFVIWGVHK